MTPGGKQYMVAIKESGIYSLILSHNSSIQFLKTKEKNMEIKVIQVGIERSKPLYKVIGSNFGKRSFEKNIFRAINPIKAIEIATECNYGSLKTGDYFRAPELDNLNDYWMLEYCYKFMNGIYKYYSDAQACAAG